MDINILGIGALLGALIVSSINLYIFMFTHKKEEIKERIDNLYSPLYVYFLMNMLYGRTSSYENYQALKKIYIRNSIYASDILKELFDEIFSKELDLSNLSQVEKEKKIYSMTFLSDKGEEKNFIYMVDRLGAYIDKEHDELQLYYAKGKISRFLWRISDTTNRGKFPAGRSF